MSIRKYTLEKVQDALLPICYLFHNLAQVKHLLNIHSNFREETFTSIKLQSISFFFSPAIFLYSYKTSVLSGEFLICQSFISGSSYTFKAGWRMPFSMR